MKRFVWAAVVGGVLLAGAMLTAQTRIASTVRSQRIELLDKDNRVRAELKVSGEETLLVLYDSSGRLRTVIDTRGITFYGEDGKLRSRIEAEGHPQ